MEADRAATPRLIHIAPAPTKAPSCDAQYGLGAADPTTMRFNCQACVRKKVRCDKAVPTCSACSRARLQCVYQAPEPRKRGRSKSEDLHERLARYERILEDNNLLPTTPTEKNKGLPLHTPNSTLVRATQLAEPNVGKLISIGGEYRYVENVLLLDPGQGDLCASSDTDQDRYDSDDARHTPSTSTGLLSSLAADTISRAILGSIQSLTEHHPRYEDAMKLWNIYVTNVDPLCKVLHVPTVQKLVETVSRQAATASKSDECLLFAIYFFAIFSIDNADCVQEFIKPRHVLLSKYQNALCQALVNASWLKTTAMPVLQAYTLFLVAMRTQLDIETFWILTGIAVRLAQRMGLHRDGESLGLPPFEVQMRRLLFWQLLPLDSYAGQVSGTCISIAPGSWDTKQPLNINDNQIYPGMAQQPQEQTGVSEMMFCLAKIELSDFYTRTGVRTINTGATIHFRDAEDIEGLVDKVEGLIETKYLRYCDILNPLHFFTLGIVRSATNAIRLRNRMPPLIKQTISDSEKRALFTLAQTILDTNTAVYLNPNVKNFQWQIQAFFLWDALLCTLLSVTTVGFLHASELKSTWTKIAEVYGNHTELVKGRRTFHDKIGELTLQAWLANPPSDSFQEPTFIAALRTQRGSQVSKRQDKFEEMTGGGDVAYDGPISDDFLGNIDFADPRIHSDFSFGYADRSFWDEFNR